MNGAEYLASLADGRAVHLDGARVADLAHHPLLGVAVAWVAESYDRARGELRLPRTQAELREFSELLLKSDTTLASTAGCFALEALVFELRDEKPETARAIEGFLAHCRAADARATVARDVFRSDLRIVERRPDGIVVSGSKTGVSGAAVVHELLVLPAGRPGAASIAFSIPVGTPGVRVVCTTTAPREHDTRHYPFARRFSVPESVVLFDDVFVPRDRILLDGDDALAARVREAVGVWERARTAAQLADRADLLMGLAQTVTEMNGVPDEANIVEKLSAIAVYATMCQAGWEAAISRSRVAPGGVCFPDDAFVYATLHHATHLYHEMVAYLHDAAGGLVITAPSIADYEHPEIGKFVEKYVRTTPSLSGAERLRVFHLIRDLTADAYGGWLKVTSQSVAGGMHAQRAATHAHYDLARARQRVREAAQLGA